MTVLERTLARIREDMRPEAAHAFVAVATDYLRAAAAGEGAVSPVPDAAAAPMLPDAGGATIADVVAAIERDVVAGANRLTHPMYLGHQVCAPLPAAVWAEPVLAALNQSIAVREMSPSATPIERGLIDWMCGLIGWTEADAPRRGGTFTSGGTEAIFTALLAARNRALPESARRGVREPAAIVCGEHAHYAVRRAASEIGLGSDGAVAVRAAGLRTDPAALARTLDALAAEGRPVVAVVANAGSTATGSFDDLDAIGRLANERGVWFHVDAAHGGSALLSPAHRHRLEAIERADSVSWDPHKMLLLPLSAGALLVRDERALEGAFAQDAPYLFHGVADRVPDQGVRSFMCSRRADALKLWVALLRYGADGLAALHDHLCDLARSFHDMLEAHPSFETVHEPESNILCFRWVDGDMGDADELNRRIRQRYNESGAGWITTTLLDGRRVLRVVVMNPLTTEAHLRATVDGLARVGAEVAAGLSA